MLLHVVHETRYQYAPSVDNAHHVVHLKPASRAGQALLRHELRISPEPAHQREVMDVYGNSSTFFSLQASHDELIVVADSIVSTTASSHGLDADDFIARTQLPWEQVREQFRYRAGAAYHSAWEFRFASPYVPRNDAFARFALPSFTPGRLLPEAAHDLMERIHGTMLMKATAPRSTRQRSKPCNRAKVFARILRTSWWPAAAPWGCLRVTSAATC